MFFTANKSAFNIFYSDPTNEKRSFKAKFVFDVFNKITFTFDSGFLRTYVDRKCKHNLE